MPSAEKAKAVPGNAWPRQQPSCAGSHRRARILGVELGGHEAERRRRQPASSAPPGASTRKTLWPSSMRGAGRKTCASTHSDHRRERAEPRRAPRRHLSPCDDDHGRDDEKRVAEEVVDGKPERRDHQHQRGELQPVRTWRGRAVSRKGGGQCWGSFCRDGNGSDAHCRRARGCGHRRQEGMPKRALGRARSRCPSEPPGPRCAWPEGQLDETPISGLPEIGARTRKSDNPTCDWTRRGDDTPCAPRSRLSRVPAPCVNRRAEARARPGRERVAADVMALRDFADASHRVVFLFTMSNSPVSSVPALFASGGSFFLPLLALVAADPPSEGMAERPEAASLVRVAQ